MSKPFSTSTWSKEQTRLLDVTMRALDQKYDEQAGLLKRTYHLRTGHDVRGSAHYALGLLVRGEKGDLERACKVINAVLDQQLDYPGEIFHGTFLRTEAEPPPAAGEWPWEEFTPENRWWLDKQFERIVNDFRKALVKDNGYAYREAQRIEGTLNASLKKCLPLVWKTYDPNWREFIAMTFAMELELFEEKLPGQLVKRIDTAMEKTVTASIERYDRNLTPMNTNIELMHIFICDYFGARFGNAFFSERGTRDAEACWKKYSEFHSFAEFNSPTYCGVDLTALALWRAYGKSSRLRELGAALEAGLWEDLGEFYNANLRNISGPFSRAYEMELSAHTSLPALLYLALGEEKVPVPALNCEDDGNILIVLGNTRMPDSMHERYLRHTGNRQVRRQFRELIERGEPCRNNPLCIATAWIEENLMIGGMAGSENTSGQLRPGTVYWKAPDGSVSSIRLSRRAVGEDSAHYRTIFFNVVAEGREMTMDVRFDVNRDMELFFEILSSDMEGASLSENAWELPGLKVQLSDQRMPAMHTVPTPGGVQVVYLFDSESREYEQMHLKLRFEPAE